MKILHIIPSYYPAFKYGGPVESVHLLNKALVKAGIAVSVLTTNAGLEDNENVKIYQWESIKGVQVKRFPYYFYEHYTFSPQLFLAALREAKNYDLIHITAFWNFPVLAGSLASLLNKKPYIISPRGMLYDEAINLKSKTIKQIYFNLSGKHYLKKVNAIHFTSEDEQDNVANIFKIFSRSFVVPNGLDLSKYSKLPDKGLFIRKYPVLQDKKYILFLGRINKKKGIDLLLQSFYSLSKEDERLMLVIAGPDNDGYKKNIENEIKKSNLAEKVLFTNLLTGDEKLQSYVDAEVFVLPSYSENFGMSVVEAMICGIPVIVSNKVGISNEIKKYNAGVVTFLNKNDLTVALKNVINSVELKSRIKLGGKKLVEEMFNIEIVAKLMIEEYKKTIMKC